LDNKVFFTIDARCNHENNDRAVIYDKYQSNSVVCEPYLKVVRWKVQNLFEEKGVRAPTGKLWSNDTVKQPILISKGTCRRGGYR